MNWSVSGSGLSPEISLQHLLENRILFGDGREEGHAGSELHIVGIAEDLGGGFSSDSEQALRALTETMTEGWVREIGARLGHERIA
jgi:hypothetical protein